MIRTFFILLTVLSSTIPGWAQPTFEYFQPTAVREGEELIHAFAGGINSAQFQTIDLDGDGDKDLVLFDRSSDKINCFENTGENYVYKPEFEFLFPDNIQHWLVLVDYDCDERKDLFTYTGQGIRVFRNVGDTNVAWELVEEPLRTQGSSSQINLFFNPTDIPSISDLDDDGDLDILVFDFSSSFQIEFHKNYSVENSGSCGFDFVRETRTYGDIRDCGCDDFTVDVPCASSSRIQHAGGKAILSLDYDLDGKSDLILSQEACNNLNLAINNGPADVDAFHPFENNFPTLNSPLGFVSFPAAFFEDVTFDGKKDILISSNERSNNDLNINFKSSSLLYRNVGGGSTNSFSGQLPFLQHQMIDVGEFAYPSLIDVDGDGINDLVIGNAGSLINGTYVSGLSYYRSDNADLMWQTDDLFNLSSLGFTYIKPQFIDINGDQRIDLIFSARNESNIMGLYYIPNEEDSGASYDLAELRSLDLNFTVLDDFHLTDVDLDGLPDLLLGLSNGRLDYYRNTGSSTSPTFTLETQEFLGITFSSERSNLSLSTGDLDGDGSIDLITTDRSGQTRLYYDYRSQTGVGSELLIELPEGESPLPSRFGRISKPSFGQLLGRNSLVIGSIQGGVRLLAASGTIGETSLSLQAFPVPSKTNGIVNFITNQSDTRLEIFTISGQKVAESTLDAFQASAINLRHLEDGLYLAKATKGGKSCTVKFVLSSSE